VVLVSTLVGTALGSIAGYFGGPVDDVISRVVDTLLAFPGLLLAIAIVAVLGPSLANVLVALTIIGWVSYARLVRGQALRAREFEYVLAARALGARPIRILWHHIVPSALPAVIVQSTLGMAGAILGEASLSFLGLGVQPPTPSWGTMLNGGRAHILDAPHLTIFPGWRSPYSSSDSTLLEGLHARADRVYFTGAGAPPPARLALMLTRAKNRALPGIRRRASLFSIQP
jgi:peptide/nickel transport system permease protein